MPFKAWKLPNKFCINNKIKEVSYKILHRIDPAKHVLERFKLNISYICKFCGQEKESILHLFFSLYLLKIILEGSGIVYLKKIVYDRNFYI